MIEIKEKRCQMVDSFTFVSKVNSSHLLQFTCHFFLTVRIHKPKHTVQFEHKEQKVQAVAVNLHIQVHCTTL
jgi:hypothetical protein